MTATHQQILDSTGALRLAAGPIRPAVPLFVEKDCEIVGDPGAWIDTAECGTALIMGRGRGKITQDHYVLGPFINAYRSRGDSYLRSQGTPWDLGPPGGWPSVKVLTVWIKAHIYGQDWKNVCVAGINGTGGPTFDVDPNPWAMYWTPDGVLTVVLAYADGTRGVYSFPGKYDPTNPDLFVAEQFVLTKPLKDNVLWPFSLGRLDPGCSSSGYWGTDGWPDIEWQDVQVTTDSLKMQISPRWCPPADYALFPTEYAPTMPVVWLQAAHKTQQDNAASGRYSVTGVRFWGGTYNPLVVLSSGYPMFDRCRFDLGYRGVTTDMQFPIYPGRFNRCVFGDPVDAAIHAWRCAQLSIRDSEFWYGRRSLVLAGCYGVVDNVMFMPPTPAQPTVVEQSGGVMFYRNVQADYEYTPAPPLIRLTPTTWDQNGFASGVRAQECLNPTGSVLDVQPRTTIYNHTYAGPTGVRVDGFDPRSRTVGGPGLSDQTIVVVPPDATPTQVSNSA